MAFNGMNRADRRAAKSYARAEVARRPTTLTPLPHADWPATYQHAKHPPTHVWVSRRYLVQMFDEEPFQSIDVYRLSINRVTLGTDGHWQENITWEELQNIKREIGFADWYAVEIYPRDRDIVNVAHLRHMWLLAEPLSIGWRSGDTPC